MSKSIRKINLAVVFGGNSVEHEISIISALQALENFDRNKYNVLPVYIAKTGEFYYGGSLDQGTLLSDISNYKNVKELTAKRQVKEVHLFRHNSKVYLAVGAKKGVEVDFVFPVVHGTNVEDGALQGFLRTLQIPFAGCDVMASANGMDKYSMKVILEKADVPVLPCLRFSRSDSADPELIIADVEKTFSYPIIIKPTNLGSSIGISKVNEHSEMWQALDKGFKYCDRILIEPAIEDLREINCSVLGDAETAQASVCEEPITAGEILSFEDKYLGGGDSGKSGSKGGSSSPASSGTKSGSSGMASLSRKIPADLPDSVRDEIQHIAVKAFQALDCAGVARIDFIIDTKTEKVWLNEINTIPGSLAFYLWEPLGIKYTELLDTIIQIGFKRARIQKSLEFNFPTNVLSSANEGVKK